MKGLIPMSYAQDVLDMAAILRKLVNTQAIQQYVNDEALRAGQADPEMLALVCEAETLCEKFMHCDKQSLSNDAPSYKIVVDLDGGMVQDVSFEIWPCIIVEIRDYDIEGTSDDETRERGYALETYTP